MASRALLLCRCLLLTTALTPDRTALAEGDLPLLQRHALASLVAKWSQESCGRALRTDPALQAVARENSRGLAEFASADARRRQTYLRFLLERYRVRDAVVLAHAVRFRAEKTLRLELLSFLRQHASSCDLTHYGLGLADPEAGGSASEHVATLLLLRRRVEILSLRAQVGQPIQICARVLSGIRPRVLVTSPGGAVQEQIPPLVAPRRPGSFCLQLSRAERGSTQVEIMVDGPLGPEVAALFPLYLGIDPPALPVEKLFPAESLRQEQAEQRLLALINRSRKRQGVAPVCPARQLAAVARDHSTDMLEGGFFGHRSPRRGDLERRLVDAGWGGVPVSENLALTTNPGRAHDALLDSPSHRKTLLDPQATHVGIGVAVDPAQGLLYVTECFARLSPKLCH
jgi:hypothetical protein